MRFEQIKDMIEHVASFHSMLGAYFETSGESTENPRLKLLRDYLMVHERAKACRLKEYTEGAPNHVLGAWFPAGSCEEKFRKLKASLSIELSTVEGVVDSMLKLYDCMIEQLESLADGAEIEGVRDVCRSIAILEKKDKMKIVRNSRMLDDL